MESANSRFDTKAIFESKTPIADRLIAIRERECSSFHALPLSSRGSIIGSELSSKYLELLGDAYIRSDVTITGKYFDSLFFSTGVIKEAEGLAAQLFNANATYFVTTGTTTANQIAIGALHTKGGRVLMDKNCHQSLHFELDSLQSNLEYFSSSVMCIESGRSIFSINELLEILLKAEAERSPYDLIVFNAHSYDGVVYKIPEIIEYILESGVSTRKFLVDEAWGSANYFSSELQKSVSMNTVTLQDKYPDLVIVATQSAHKSLNCLRQASMIHLRGPEDIAHKIYNSRFRIHTTSPSYPILASLDLARAQMAACGISLMNRATYLAKKFIKCIEEDPLLSCYTVNLFEMPNEPFEYATTDPAKVSLNVAELTDRITDFRDLLFQEYGIYINRMTGNSMLINFHIGIDDRQVDLLLDALRELQKRFNPSWLSKGVSDSFIVPYPPGVPIIAPGEIISEKHRTQIRDIARSGSSLFIV